MAAPTKGTEPAGGDPAEHEDQSLLGARREQRRRRKTGYILAVGLFAVVAIAISRGGAAGPPKPGSPQARADVAAVTRLLRGIPQSGVILGSPRAPVTVTEFADLECSFCRTFALGAERQLISHEVRHGDAKLVYRSLCTATCTGPLGQGGFTGQQATAYAAGLQDRGWNYIELFYEEQGNENTDYVTARYLEGLARQIAGLDYRRWTSDDNLPRLRRQVAADEAAAQARNFGITPSIVVTGPRGTARPLVGGASYGQLRSAIDSVR